MCIILNHEKTTLPMQDIFVENFLIWRHSFSLGQICVGSLAISLKDNPGTGGGDAAETAIGGSTDTSIKGGVSGL